MWKYVRPVNAIAAVLEEYLSILPREYTAVHLRKTFDVRLTPQEKCRCPPPVPCPLPCHPWSPSWVLAVPYPWPLYHP